jgi:hypothetical protein
VFLKRVLEQVLVYLQEEKLRMKMVKREKTFLYHQQQKKD